MPKYEVVVPFKRRNRQTGEETNYTVGDPYSGPDIDLYLKGLDQKGPNIREVREKRSPAPTPSLDSLPEEI